MNDSHADQFDAVCGVWFEQSLSDSLQCWQHSYVYFPNTTSGYDAEHMHSTSLFDHGKTCSNHCMVLATVLQLSFRVLEIFL